jgi:hypothetical protein
MSKPVTIRVDDQLHALLKERALLVCGGVSVGPRHLSVSGTGLLTWRLALTDGAYVLLT